MPARLRITLLFVLIVVIILGLVCGGVYYFSYSARINVIKTRLTNRAVTTARLLAQRETFDQRLVQRIDSLTTIAQKNKTVQAYDYENNKIYNYSDIPGDTLHIETDVLDDARVNGSSFFNIGDKEVVAYHYADENARMVVVSAAEDVDGKQGLQTLRNILLLSFLVGTAIVFISGYVFSARLLRPIARIAADVEDISALNLSRRIKTGRSKDEWERLASTLNRLLNRLQESFELQRRFIANASHELSTPLTSISSQLEVSLQRERDAADYRAVMQSIHQDVRHMNKLTQTLLAFAKASGDAGGLEIKPVRMDEILLHIPAEMAKINQGYSVLLRFDELPENESDLMVFGNETLLLTAIKNIVVNACKYSEEHRATVKLEIKEKKIIISIADKGRGIPPGELKTIFQPFYRVENTEKEGFGLGLSLAERIIKLHKGTISVESSVNEGTCFYIFLPMA
jgi:two-component system, OmpR family, sensor histidine kinase ArlS